MEASTADLGRAFVIGYARRIDWAAAWTWVLGFGLVVYLGLEGGGYDPLVHDQVGIAVWWVLLAAVAVGALPRRRLRATAWAALGLLAAFLTWSALSLTWTESFERTAADVARVAGYLGVFALALFSRDSKGTRRMVAAVGTGIACVALVALLSRLHSSWFPEGQQTARFLTSSRERLSYPLNYWNALAALIAIGLPLILHVATSARATAARALAAGASPALALTSFLTLSRGGIAAAFVAVGVYIAFTSERLSKLATIAASGAGGAVLVAAAAHRAALQHGLDNEAAQHQGDEMLAIVIVVCAGVALLQVALAVGWPRGAPKPWSPMPRRRALAAWAAAAAVLVLAAVALGAPGRVSNAWSDFKGAGTASGPGGGTARLSSASGNGRYQYWRAAAKENASKPLTGTGSGTFEFWWNRNGDIPGTVRDAHSLYMQTLGELGIVGIALLAAFLLTVLFSGSRLALRARSRERSQLAAALAGILAFCITAGFDWMWQIPVLPVAMLLLAAALIGARSGPGSDRPRLGPGRLAIVSAAIAAIAAIAIPLACEAQLRQSRADAAEGKLGAALTAARSAANAEPAAAAPRLQQALVLEEGRRLATAADAVRAAVERNSTDWRPWLVLSRIEAERGRAAASVAAYGRARTLNPRSTLFTH